jgi:hypothetical protein
MPRLNNSRGISIMITTIYTVQIFASILTFSIPASQYFWHLIIFIPLLSSSHPPLKLPQNTIVSDFMRGGRGED